MKNNNQKLQEVSKQFENADKFLQSVELYEEFFKGVDVNTTEADIKQMVKKISKLDKTSIEFYCAKLATLKKYYDEIGVLNFDIVSLNYIDYIQYLLSNNPFCYVYCKKEFDVNAAAIAKYAAFKITGKNPVYYNCNDVSVPYLEPIIKAIAEDTKDRILILENFGFYYDDPISEFAEGFLMELKNTIPIPDSESQVKSNEQFRFIFIDSVLPENFSMSNQLLEAFKDNLIEIKEPTSLEEKIENLITQTLDENYEINLKLKDIFFLKEKLLNLLKEK